MADDLLFVYSSPGPVPEAEFNDWYDHEHVPARLAVPGFGSIARFSAADGLAPEWLATYSVARGTLESDAYRAVGAAASAREKSIMSAATIDRRVYSLISDSGVSDSGVSDSGVSDSGVSSAVGVSGGVSGGRAGVVMAVSMSVPAEAVDDMTAWYGQEHIPMLLAVPGWRRCRRYVLTDGTAPPFLSLHEIESLAALDEPAYQAAVSTPWRNRVVESALARERRVFALHAAFR